MCVFVYVWVHATWVGWSQKLEEDNGFFGTGVTGNWELDVRWEAHSGPLFCLQPQQFLYSYLLWLSPLIISSGFNTVRPLGSESGKLPQ